MKRSSKSERNGKACSALLIFSLLSSTQDFAWATAAEAYNPPSAGELRWASGGNLLVRPTGAQAYVEDNYLPWWQTRVAHPIADYDASKLEKGVARLDTALDAEYTIRRALPGWTYRDSPSGITNNFTYTAGSKNRADQVGRGGQAAYLNLGLRPLESISADIGAELLGNYDDRFWFPVNDENRMHNADRWGKIVRAHVKYENENFMLRGFDGVMLNDWAAKNDLFLLLPEQLDVEYYRRASGTNTPRGGEMRAKTPFGTLNVLGGSEIRWGYGPSVFAKYDFPTYRNLETSLVYRNEDVPFGKVVANPPEERRWSMSLNTSYPFSERVHGHFGILYQPFRLNRTYQDFNGVNDIETKTTKRKDAFGATLRTEIAPEKWLDRVGVGYTYLGATAGNKQQLDLDAGRTFLTNWNLSGAYIYRQPVVGPMPLLYEGTVSNPGALVTAPRGPDDPFWVQWDNRKAHIASLTLAFDPTPATTWFKYRPNVMEDWNLNLEEDAGWVGLVQYRMTDYLTNTDRLYYYNEDRSLTYDPIFHTGARATGHPFHSATGMMIWRQNKWRTVASLSGGEALAAAGIAYTSATNFYKPSTRFMTAMLSLDNKIVKLFSSYQTNVWGPADYHTQLGWAYKKIYQAGISYNFLRDFQTGFRYVGTRMENKFIGSDTGAFNEYRFYLTYHFGLQHNFSRQMEGLGRPLPRGIPEASLTVSDTSFTPDGSGPTRMVLITPRAAADAGILSYQMYIRNAQGEIVRKWEGGGQPTTPFRWDGLDTTGKPLAAGTYRATLSVADLYGNEATSPAQSIDIVVAAPPPVTEAPVEAPAKNYTVTTTPEGLKVTLSSLVLFDVGKSDLREAARAALKPVNELLKAYPNNVLRVSGHTDATGGEQYNLDLSLRRAQAVADYLVNQGGVDRSRITFLGYGKKRPVASNKTEEGRQQNRRVEIEILK